MYQVGKLGSRQNHFFASEYKVSSSSSLILKSKIRCSHDDDGLFQSVSIWMTLQFQYFTPN